MAGSVVPEKLQTLRGSSLARRIEAERRRNLPRQRNPQGKPKLSKYRRKCANAKERERMSKVNDMFDKLKTIVPEGLVKDLDDKETKVTTLRSAITYIHELQKLLHDYDAGSLDPSRYRDLDTDKENNKKISKIQNVIKMSKNGTPKKRSQTFKRKSILKVKRVDYSRPKPKQSVRAPRDNPATVQLTPCDIQAVSQDYMMYREAPPPVEYMVYQAGQHAELGDPQKDYIVYTQRDPGPPAEKDYMIYRTEGDAAHLTSAKDLNVISLYISLIDGKRTADGKFSSEL